MNCEGKERPLLIVLTPGQRHERTQLLAVLDGIRVKRRSRGRPRTRPLRVLADKGSSYPSYRRLLRHRGICHVIPTRSDQRRLPFDRTAYRRRTSVERCINRLKQFRGLATRYEKHAVNYRAMVVIASLLIWLRDSSDTP
jgi:transposase